MVRCSWKVSYFPIWKQWRMTMPNKHDKHYHSCHYSVYHLSAFCFLRVKRNLYNYQPSYLLIKFVFSCRVGLSVYFQVCARKFSQRSARQCCGILYCCTREKENVEICALQPPTLCFHSIKSVCDCCICQRCSPVNPWSCAAAEAAILIRSSAVAFAERTRNASYMRYMFLRTITAGIGIDDLWPRYLECWCILTLIKFEGQRHRSNCKVTK